MARDRAGLVTIAWMHCPRGSIACTTRLQRRSMVASLASPPDAKTFIRLKRVYHRAFPHPACSNSRSRALLGVWATAEWTSGYLQWATLVGGLVGPFPVPCQACPGTSRHGEKQTLGSDRSGISKSQPGPAGLTSPSKYQSRSGSLADVAIFWPRSLVSNWNSRSAT